MRTKLISISKFNVLTKINYYVMPKKIDVNKELRVYSLTNDLFETDNEKLSKPCGTIPITTI